VTAGPRPQFLHNCSMEFRNLGHSGLRVSLAGLGCNNFGRRCDAKQTDTIVSKALEIGVTFFDTADVYGPGGVSEEYLGAALAARRHDAVIATKFAMPMGEGAVPVRRVSALHLRRGRGEPAPPADRLHRSLPDASSRPR